MSQQVASLCDTMGRMEGMRVNMVVGGKEVRCAVPHFNHELFVHVVVLQGKPEAGASSVMAILAIVTNQDSPKHVRTNKPQLES